MHNGLQTCAALYLPICICRYNILYIVGSVWLFERSINGHWTHRNTTKTELSAPTKFNTYIYIYVRLITDDRLTGYIYILHARSIYICVVLQRREYGVKNAFAINIKSHIRRYTADTPYVRYSILKRYFVQISIAHGPSFVKRCWCESGDDAVRCGEGRTQRWQ